MTDLLSLIQKAKQGEISPQELVEILDELSASGRDLGMVEVKDVVAAFDRCSPPLGREELLRIKNVCRSAANRLQGSGKAYSVKDFNVLVDEAERRLATG
jgi:hypothetical protein